MQTLSKEAQVIQTLFSIPNKQGTSVPFKLNPAQIAYDQSRTKRDIITKARQKGFSSLGIAYQVVDCLGVEGTRAVLISHEASATQRLLDKARFYLEHMDGPAPILGRKSRNEYYFPKTESSLYIGTAGARAFGRGDTITNLHISEYAWWEHDGLKYVAGLMQAVPMTGSIRIESTGNGRVNDFFYMCQNHETLGYNRFFRSWWEDDEYSMTPPEEWDPQGFENYFQDLKTNYPITENQLYWYWMKLNEFRLDLRFMQQEYPSTYMECFQATGGDVFPDVKQAETNQWKWKMREGRRIEYLTGHPRKKHTYVLGADPSGGTGNDDAGVQILCMETLEQVFEFYSNTMDPVAFAYFIAELGKEYNEAFIIPEGNHHGIAVLAVLKKNYPRARIYKRHVPSKGIPKYGFMTTESTKPELVGLINELMDEGLALYGQKTVNEMLLFHETPEGKLGGTEDDLVMSLGLACKGLRIYWRYRHEVEQPVIEKPSLDRNYMYMTFEEIIGGIYKRNHSGPREMYPDQLRRDRP